MKKYVLIVTLALASVTVFAATAAPAGACASYSPGYWMNHPDAWPCGGGVYIGGVWYSSATAIPWMQTPVARDKRITAFFIVAAASLDVYESWGDERSTAFAAANAWVATHLPWGPGGPVLASSADWQAIEPTITFLASTFE